MITGISSLLQVAIDPLSLGRRLSAPQQAPLPETSEATASTQNSPKFSAEALKAAEEHEKAQEIPEQETQDSEESSAQKSNDFQELTQEEQRKVEELKQTDREVRTHENAHKAAAGDLAVGGPSYTYERGPDNKRYAVAGEVNIQIPQGGEPEERLQKAMQAQQAALAPAEPSAQDRAVASKATRMAAEARQEMMAEEAEKQEKVESPSSDEPSPATPAQNHFFKAYQEASSLSNQLETSVGILV